MPQNPTAKGKKIEQPENHYESPTEVAKDGTLTNDEKKRALNTWEQDARQLLIASDEGMPTAKGQDHRMEEVQRAKEDVDDAKRKRSD
jgi:hypothetical protein